jgi:hypothetical protein
MNLVMGTSVIIAVITNEDHKGQLIGISKGADLIAPASIHWEIGNAFSLMFKRNRIGLERATSALEPRDLRRMCRFLWQRLALEG